jgi:hypothetical protein
MNSTQKGGGGDKPYPFAVFTKTTFADRLGMTIAASLPCPTGICPLIKAIADNCDASDSGICAMLSSTLFVVGGSQAVARFSRTMCE